MKYREIIIFLKYWIVGCLGVAVCIIICYIVIITISIFTIIITIIPISTISTVIPIIINIWTGSLTFEIIVFIDEFRRNSAFLGGGVVACISTLLRLMCLLFAWENNGIENRMKKAEK